MQWQPAHEVHAIERCTITLDFNEQIPARAWRDILEKCSTMAAQLGFGGRNDQPGMIGMQPPPGFPNGPFIQLNVTGQHVGQDQSLGRVHTKSDETGVRESLSLRRNQFAFTTHRYAGWPATKQQILLLIGAVVDSVLSLIEINGYRLEYWNRFTSISKDAKYSELLDFTSEYIANVGSTTNKLWHSHSGFYVPSNNSGDRLIYINIDAIEIPDQFSPESLPELRRSISLMLLSQAGFNDTNQPESFENLLTCFEESHTYLKAIMKSIITPEMAGRLSLYARENASINGGVK